MMIPHIIEIKMFTVNTLDIDSYSLTIQYSLNAIGFLFFYIAVYEFICAQSPHAMKGLVIETFFAIEGVFQLLGAVITYVLLAFGWNIVHTFLSYGFVYYLISAIIALHMLLGSTSIEREMNLATSIAMLKNTMLKLKTTLIMSVIMTI